MSVQVSGFVELESSRTSLLETKRFLSGGMSTRSLPLAVLIPRHRTCASGRVRQVAMYVVAGSVPRAVASGSPWRRTTRLLKRARCLPRSGFVQRAACGRASVWDPSCLPPDRGWRAGLMNSLEIRLGRHRPQAARYRSRFCNSGRPTVSCRAHETRGRRDASSIAGRSGSRDDYFIFPWSFGGRSDHSDHSDPATSYITSSFEWRTRHDFGRKPPPA